MKEKNRNLKYSETKKESFGIQREGFCFKRTSSLNVVFFFEKRSLKTLYHNEKRKGKKDCYASELVFMEVSLTDFVV